MLKKLKLSKEFWSEVHSKAIVFRNKKRKEYLKGKLNDDEKLIVESWDKRPRLLNEEPLSTDIKLNIIDRKK